MNSEHKFKKIESINDWQGLLAQAKFFTFSHNVKWENFIEQEFKQIKFERYLYGNSLLLSLARIKSGSSIKYVSHPFCEYGGPLPLVRDINFGEFLADLGDKFGNNIKINFHPAVLQYFVNVESKGETQHGLNSYWVDWRSMESSQFLQNVRKTLRHSIDSLAAENYQIKPCQNENELSTFYYLYLNNMRRKMNLVLPYSFFQYFFNSENAEIVLAVKDSRVVAGSVFLKYGEFAHYFLNAGLGENNPSSLILFEQAKKAVAQKKVLDLGGTRGGSSLEIFKQGWRGEVKPILQIGQTNSSMRKSVLRRFWRVMPLQLIQPLSKKLFIKVL